MSYSASDLKRIKKLAKVIAVSTQELNNILGFKIGSTYYLNIAIGSYMVDDLVRVQDVDEDFVYVRALAWGKLTGIPIKEVLEYLRLT